ncbi:MAG TPA: chromosome segregation protein SMC [Vicinamibacterales bacterium]|nr:chromosome segregation protein SMC [Vicinamibacterales bacterium]
MRLERLEIAGFKSFSDRSELAFDEGVTAIVGPNGCGKSNVADAITWVLGEQSAKSLRGDKMEDVIFSGSDGRKPGAAAEVRLRLTGLALPPSATGPVDGLPPANGNGHGNGNGHSDGNGNGNGHHPSPSPGTGASFQEIVEAFTRDVEVTRRLYRSGESEYLIDGEVCRLRDVHELLMDTGLGAKAYAIIEQGKIGMILSSRPTDRRQLIEEAAGITKYKSRRRAAELKLEAAQQNLTRVDDIVFEVEKQRGTLKRQAAKARRYKRLRDELRRWEKVLFARRYRELAHAIETARASLAAARERETAAAARVAEVEADLARLRIEQAEADRHAASVRERAHAAELDINRRQQQVDFDRQQAASLATRTTEIADEIRDLEARREPARLAIEAREQACAEAERARDEAAAVLADASESLARAQQRIDVSETAVDAARTQVYVILNSLTTLRHAMEHAAAQRGRVGETLAKLDVEEADVFVEVQKVEADRIAASDALRRAHEALDAVRVRHAEQEAALAAARGEYDAGTRRVRSGEQDLAGLEARLASLEELVATRGEFGDAARMVLVQANGHVGQQGAVADYLDVDRRYERAVEACLGELLQHVIVERHEQAAAGLALVREHDAGRCGFVVIDPGSNGHHAREALRMPGVVPVSDVLRIAGPHAATIQHVIPEAYVAETFEQAVAVSRETTAPVATIGGDVFRGPHLVSGGARAESRGILATKREIKELRQRIAADRAALTTVAERVSALEIAMAEAASAIVSLTAEQHRQEKVIVGHDAQLGRVAEDTMRLARKAEVIGLERRQAEEERLALDARTAEGQQAIAGLEDAQRAADGSLSDAQRGLAAAKEAAGELNDRAGAARAAHAGLLERAAGLAGETARLREAARELEERIAARSVERAQMQGRREELLQSIGIAERTLDDEIQALEAMREQLRLADEAAGALRAAVDAQDAAIRQARQLLEAIRAEVGGLDIARVTAESDLAHLAQSCVDTVQVPLDAVLADVEAMERAGETVPDAAAITAEEPEEDLEPPDPGSRIPDPGPAPTSMSAEEAIAALRAKIDRLGPVNMMAIEQFDELEARYAFLTTQRRDLVESIAQTIEAIRRIDETSTARFAEAFAAIQENFQSTFSTLFGGGRAGLTLLDENDPLESGIDIVASPPGKRLQSVQLLSGGEKALTAIALMFAIFKYKPSPFCLLDEIDAPLDDANVGRFVEMLRGMLDRTQFILITHNRRTMEIANRLYGVTMEEPGVSKLISVQLN